MIIIPDGLSYDKKVRTGSLSVRNVAFTSVRNNWIHKERFLMQTNSFSSQTAPSI